MNFLPKIAACLLLCLMAKPATAQDNRYLPKSTTGQIVKHANYILSYSEKHEQPEWVAYELTSTELTKRVSRTDDFRPDPAVKTGSASLADYKGKGYDRGHLFPAADGCFSKQAMTESFYMSNMSPQAPELNRGAWKNLEEQVRKWAKKEGKIYVVTGPILSGQNKKIGKNGVTVPSKYYKIVYDLTNTPKCVAFLMPNGKCAKPRSSYVVSIDKLEALTGIDFFPALPDAVENRMEAQSTMSGWTTSTTFSSSKKTTPAKRAGSVRCKAKTKKTGNRCKNMTKNPKGLCHVHD
ncbi:hypothetical protein FUAX_00970 [Fulvitalea axinellae]|uniref:Endonuclease n=1 Tax=Fulvitalea axinellae TaxID=1182444 RepID=A0AAU9D670_9BACT|nr:hypothetical protein FUAX_00970 [Fulvitalea axinellae]